MLTEASIIIIIVEMKLWIKLQLTGADGGLYAEQRNNDLEFGTRSREISSLIGPIQDHAFVYIRHN